MIDKVYLAPLAGITDAAMRSVCRDFGCTLAYTEMVSAKGIKYNNKRTKELLEAAPGEDNIGVQLFGSESDIISDMAKAVCDECNDLLREININMGCPAPKIVNNGEGAALMRDMKKAADIISKTVKASRVPVSVKFRSGFDEKSINAVEFAKMAEDSGAAFICVHGRTREQFYSGKADREIIRKVKEAVKIPVIGNGDIFDGPSAKDMIDTTGCDGIMVARGALGNPFIFTEIKEYFEFGKKITEVTPKMRIETCLKQARLAAQAKGEHLATLQMRKHAAYYLKGMKNSAKARNEVVRAVSIAQLEEMMYKYLYNEQKNS